LIEPKGLEEVKKDFVSSPPILLVVKLISVERKEDGFSLPFLASYIIFRLLLHLTFECIIYLKITGTAKDFYPGIAWASNQAFFCCLKLAFALQSSVL
jgi:hypothetical protein